MITEKVKVNAVKSAQGLAKWFELDFTLKIFGVEVIHWHYPPAGSSDDR